MAKTKKPTRRNVKTAKKTTRRPPAKRAQKRAATPAAPTPRTVTPYLSVNDGAGAIEWYKRAFGAKEASRQLEPSGKVMHAALRLGDSEFFLSDIFPGSDTRDPTTTGPSVTLHVWSKDADKIWKQATANGAKVTMPMDDMFWGDRYGKIVDPYGHSWSIAWRSKLSKAELEKRREQAMKQLAPGSPA